MLPPLPLDPPMHLRESFEVSLQVSWSDGFPEKAICVPGNDQADPSARHHQSLSGDIRPVPENNSLNAVFIFHPGDFIASSGNLLASRVAARKKTRHPLCEQIVASNGSLKQGP